MIGVGYGRKLTDKFSVGGQVKYVSDNLGAMDTFNSTTGVLSANQQADLTSLLFDFGTSYHTGWNGVVIASTDMTHFEPKSVAERQDAPLIDLMVGLDADGFWRAVERTRASVCGYAPVTATLTAAKLLGATRGEKLSYYTSGEIQAGPVVGYASVALLKD